MKGKELRISGTVMGQSARRWALRWVLVGVLVIMEPVSHAWPGGFDSFEQQQFDQLIVQCGADWPDVEPFNPCPNDRLAGLESPFGGDLIDSNPGDGKCEAIYTIAEGDVVLFIHTCTLRAAIMEANALGGGPHTIFLQAGATYTLFQDADGGGHATDSGANNDDLDITSQITIQGNGATIERSTAVVCTRNGIAEGGEFRIFHVHGTGNLTLQDLTVRNGCSPGPSIFTDGTGGGIANDGGRVTITNVTLSGNSALLAGGIDNDGGTVTITNSTLSGNSALFAGGITNAGMVNVSFVTIANNTGSTTGAGGIFNDARGTVNIKNSIVANNTGGPNCSGTLNASGVNFATDNTCTGFTQVNSSQLNLQPLADNGGPTQTHALGPGSVAIDAASECTDVGGNVVSIDQRGVTRPQGSRCDAGAFEREAAGYRLHLPLVVR